MKQKIDRNKDMTLVEHQLQHQHRHQHQLRRPTLRLHAVHGRAEAKLARLHLPLVFLKLSSLLLFFGQEGSVLPAACAALLDAAENDQADDDDEQANGSSDDADLGALRERMPPVAHARWRLDLFQDFRLATATLLATICTRAKLQKQLTI